ncbi:lysis system i-spanin subunit Rz [Escherichia coli]
MTLPLVVVGCTSKQSVSQRGSYHRLRRGQCSLPPLAHTALQDYFTLRERLIIMQKQLEGT